MSRLVCLVYLVVFSLAVVASVASAARSPANLKLRVSISGGTVGVIRVTSLSGNHPECLIDCTYPYPPGTKVTIKAQPAANVTHFVGWSGACTGHKPTCALTLRKSATVVARFALGG
jgi:hypothetical protein